MAEDHHTSHARALLNHLRHAVKRGSGGTEHHDRSIGETKEETATAAGCTPCADHQRREPARYWRHAPWEDRLGHVLASQSNRPCPDRTLPGRRRVQAQAHRQLASLEEESEGQRKRVQPVASGWDEH